MPDSGSTTTLVDRARLHQLITEPGAGDQADGLEDLRELIELLDPHSRAFGTDVATLVDECLDHGLLRPQPPVTGITITPTTRGEYRDGAFLVLADITGTITLVSTRIDPDQFTDPVDPLALEVLDVVAATVDQLYAAYRTTAAGQAGR